MQDLHILLDQLERLTQELAQARKTIAFLEGMEEKKPWTRKNR